MARFGWPRLIIWRMLSFLCQPDVVVGTALAMGAQVVELDLEVALLEAAGKGIVWDHRPDRENAVGAQGMMCGEQPLFAIEPVIAAADQAVWTVVDIEENLIVG